MRVEILILSLLSGICCFFMGLYSKSMLYPIGMVASYGVVLLYYLTYKEKRGSKNEEDIYSK